VENGSKAATAKPGDMSSSGVRVAWHAASVLLLYVTCAAALIHEAWEEYREKARVTGVIRRALSRAQNVRYTRRYVARTVCLKICRVIMPAAALR